MRSPPERLRAALAAARRSAPNLARDAAGLAGAGAVAHGAGLVYAPAGWICAGVLLLGGAYLAGRAGT